MGEGEKEGKCVGMLPRGRTGTGFFVSRVFISLMQAEILGEVSGDSFSRISISFPSVSF